MKSTFKKYLILLVFILFNVTTALADSNPSQTPPAPGGGGGPGGSGAPPLPPATPIDSGIVILIMVALLLGTYTIFQYNKKRQLEN